MEIKFKRGSEVRHRKGRVFKIFETPETLCIEMNSKTIPAYAYLEVGSTGPIWVRPKEEMEDGRFENHKG